ncbi:MAG: hypothetical protein Q6362_008865 [Candidatus Wukongarchaeota archaeon]|nr:hypothetical protein [Candidatus Wukongarchaeota archaeon]
MSGTEEGIALFREAMEKLEELKDEGLKGFCVTSVLTGEYLSAEFSTYVDKEEFSKNVGRLIKSAEKLRFEEEDEEDLLGVVIRTASKAIVVIPAGERGILTIVTAPKEEESLGKIIQNAREAAALIGKSLK